MLAKYSVKVPELRKFLSSTFSDMGLIDLCQDEFSDLTIKIGMGRGLTKEEIITYIIDYFQRRQDFSSLLNAIKTREPERYDEYESKIISYVHITPSQEIIAPDGLIRREDWGEAIDTGTFLGRKHEIEQAGKWVREDRCRVIALLGMGGIGKSSLAIQIIEFIKKDFDYLFWRDLRNAPPIDLILDDAIKFFSEHKGVENIPTGIDAKITTLIECFKNSRCLLVLDNAEAILQGGDNAGRYREGYEAYGSLAQRIGGSQHKSCLFITSREKPREISLLEGKFSPVRAMPLTGLDDEAAHKLVSEHDLFGTTEHWQSLFKLYGGNPLALKISAVYIHDWCNGDIEKFLKDDVAVFGEIEDLLKQQLERLPDYQKEIMYWLAIERGAISLSQLQKEVMRWLVIQREPASVSQLLKDFVTPVTKDELVSTLDSLKRMYLVEKADSKFTLQPVIMEYLTKQFVKLVFNEFVVELPRLLRSHSLIQAQAKEHIRESQERFILEPLISRILSMYDIPSVEKKFKNILQNTRNESRIVPGYVGGNAINLLTGMNVDLTGWDFSRLSIWQANLREIPLHNVDFSYSDLKDSIFAETFDLILSVAYSPNGEFIAAGAASGDVFLWRVSENRQIQVLHGHSNWVRAVAFSPDNNLLASGSGDHTIKIWDLTTGQCIRTLLGHTDWLRSLAFNPDGSLLASAASDKLVKIWKVSDGSLYRNLVGHSDWVWSVCFDKSGKFVASGGNDNFARVWDVETSECLSNLQHPDWVRSVAFDPSGTRIASGCNDGVVRLWEWKEPRIQMSLSGHTDRIWCVTFDHTGEKLASSSFDRTIRLWDAIDGRPLRTLQGHTGWVISLFFSYDNQFLVSGSEDQTVRIWDMQSGNCVRVFKGHTNCFQSIDISEKLLVSGSTDQTIRIWQYSTGECLRVLRGHTNRIQSVSISADGKIIASGGDDQTIRIWDLESAQFPKILKGHTSWVRSVMISPDTKYVASGCDDLKIGVWEIKNGSLYKFFTGHKGFVATVAFHPDSTKLASGSADKTIKIWDLSSGDQIVTLSGHSLRVNNIKFSHDGKYLVSASEDGKILIWDWLNEKDAIVLDAHIAPIKFIAFNRDSSLLISGGDDQILKLWDIKTLTLRRTFVGHIGRIWSGVFSLDSNYIITASEDETIRLWNMDNGECERIMRSQNLYDGLNIIGVRNLTEVQKNSLKLLGAQDT